MPRVSVPTVASTGEIIAESTIIVPPISLQWNISCCRRAIVQPSETVTRA
ncbi:MAG: hypothetical protein LBK41_08675 [Clostridiales bacterium]|nr:hypothetical protein [Clostridiales bacterium]